MKTKQQTQSVSVSQIERIMQTFITLPAKQQQEVLQLCNNVGKND